MENESRFEICRYGKGCWEVVRRFNLMMFNTYVEHETSYPELFLGGALSKAADIVGPVRLIRSVGNLINPLLYLYPTYDHVNSFQDNYDPTQVWSDCLV